MADEVMVVEQVEEVTIEETDAITEAQANAEAIIKNAQRKQSEADQALHRARQLEAEAKARYEAQQTKKDDDDDPMAQARKVISDEVRKILDEQNSKSQEQKVEETVSDFRTNNNASDVQMVAIFDYFEKESIVPQTPKALERALNKAYKELFASEDNTEALIAKLQQKGKVVQVTKKSAPPVTDERPISERKDLSFEEKRNRIWNRK